MRLLFEDRAVLLMQNGVRYLVIADLHIGIEYELERKGIKTKGFVEDDALRLIWRERPDEVIILGDLGHALPGDDARGRELQRIRRFIASAGVPIRLVKGNHDGALERSIDIEVTSAMGLGVGDAFFFHGHARPLELRSTNVMAHIHPHVMIRDGSGYSALFPCWLVSRDFITMPAFNPLVGGVAVNRDEIRGVQGEFITPDTEVWMGEGLFLGTLRDLRNDDDGARDDFEADDSGCEDEPPAPVPAPAADAMAENTKNERLVLE